MGERMPRLLEHLDSRGLPPEMLACDFMLSLGCRALPPTSVLRVWDLLFWEGGDTLQFVMLAVLRVAEVRQEHFFWSAYMSSILVVSLYLAPGYNRQGGF